MSDPRKGYAPAWCRVPVWTAAILLFGWSGASMAADFTVNSTADKSDSAPGDGKCSTGGTVNGKPECTLRAAIDEVNALSATHATRTYSVALGAGTYTPSLVVACPYHDVGNPNLLSRNTSTLCISGNLDLKGAGPGVTIVDGNLLDRIFFISVGATVSMDGLTIQRGLMPVPGSFDGLGAGINNQGVMTASNILFQQNDSNNPSGNGGAIFNAGTLVVAGSTFRANAGTAITSRGPTSIDQSYFTQNTADQGAAIEMFEGSLQLSNSTLAGNTVTSNAIIGNFNGPAVISNSTISNNTVGNAGSVVSSGNGSSMSINNSTIYGNSATTTSGGLMADNAIVANSILAGNAISDCVVTGLVNVGHNLIQTAFLGDFKSLCPLGTNVTTITGTDPKLAPLTINIGTMPTNVPLAGSPAIGAGSSATPGSNSLSACTAIDESGSLRGQFGTCSIGASEPLAAAGLHVNTVTPSAHGAGGTSTIVVHGAGFVSGSTVSFKKSGAGSLTLTDSVVAADTQSIAATLDFTGASVGSYDVVVTTPAGASTSLTGALSVQATTSPDIYSYVVGTPFARAHFPAFFSVIVGNRGNADAYLVPVTLALPGSLTGSITSQILPPPAVSGQAITDWSQVPLEVAPFSSIAFTSVPLLIPVLRPGQEAVLTFYLGVQQGAFTVDANSGKPYGTTAGGVDATALAQLVSGASGYAQANYGVTLTSADLAKMSTYAAGQLAHVIAQGASAAASSAGAEQPYFSTAQLTVDVAAYGASLEGRAPAAVKASQVAHAARTLALAASPGGSGKVPCTGQVLAPGASCGSLPDPVPSPGGSGRLSCSNLILHVLADDGACVPNPSSCPSSNPDAPTCGGPTLPVTSHDPNEKSGPRGLGSSHFVKAADAFHYVIEFENSASASAAAQTVTVTDQLDRNKFDLSTLQLSSISFGNYVVTPSPGLTSFSKALDLRPSANVVVAIRAKLDPATGVVTWTFTSLDPATMKLVTDPLAGFLPPDNSPPAGIGHVEFTIRPLGTVASGTQICNTATIVFDTNAPIATTPFCNSKDTTAPMSRVTALPAVSPATSFPVTWSGTDAGAGIATYSIFVSDNGAPFTPLITDTATTTIAFSGATGHTYAFFSRASDALGNIEAAKNGGDTSTSVGTAATISVPNVVGLSQSAASAALTTSNLSLGTVTSQASATVVAGLVISESPGAGSKVAPKSSVSLVVSTGPATVAVPNVVGLTQVNAGTAITTAGLTLGVVTTISSATVAKGLVISENPVAGTRVAAKAAIALTVSAGPAPVTVPNVVGLTQAAATTAITGVGLTLGTVTTVSNATLAKGQVISESPAAGSSVAAKSAVSLVISSGPAAVTVPNVTGLAQAAAASALSSAGLTLGTVTAQASATVPAGIVIGESPLAGSVVTAKSSVSLVVSTGPSAVTVPNVIGATRAAATTAIMGAGLTLGPVTTASSATVTRGLVISESPAAGSNVAAKAAVSLLISSGPAPVTVPNVIGLAQAAASTALTTAGLSLGTVTMQSSMSVAPGAVISESPAAGASVVAKTPVSLVVSSGPAPVTVPNVIGLSQSAAASAITGAGLAVGAIATVSSATVPSGQVISESPGAGAKVPAASAVTLVLSSGPEVPLVGDVNGDGVVNCTDLVLVKAAFGTSRGQANFDAKADINGDGVVNVTDLALVARAVPAGTTCN